MEFRVQWLQGEEIKKSNGECGEEMKKCVQSNLAMDEGDAVSVASQMTDRLRSVLLQCPPVPHLAQSVIAAREEQLG